MLAPVRPGSSSRRWNDWGSQADEDEYRRAFLFEGVSWRNQYTRIVHGELTREETRGDGPWEAWRSGARSAVREARRGR